MIEQNGSGCEPQQKPAPLFAGDGVDFQGLARLAARVCGTEAAVIVTVEDQTKRIKAVHGASTEHIHDAMALITRTLTARDPVIIPDVSKDSLFSRLSERHAFCFYAGLPLVAREGYRMGVIAVIDHRTRNLSALQMESLSVMSGRLAAELELRRQCLLLAQAATERSDDRRLRNSETLLQIAGEMARFGGWSIELPGKKLLWSREIHAILDFPGDTAPALDEVLALYPPSSRKVIIEALENCERYGTPFDRHLEIRTPGGRLLNVRAIGRAVRDENGNIARIDGAFQDISQQKQAEERMLALSNRLASTLESITDPFFTLDRNWCFTYVNRQAEHVLGRGREDLLGKNVWEEFPEAVGKEFYREYHRAMQDNVTVSFVDYYEPLDLWAEVRAYPSPEGLAIHFRDVTDQRRIQSAVMKLAASVSASTGPQFFENLALSMADALGAQASFIARFLPDEPLAARTVAATVDGKVIDNFDYQIAGTPCELIVQKDLCVVPDDAATLFPRSPSLATLGARSYVGQRLDHSAGQPLGLLFVLYRKPLKASEFITSTLQIFAARAASELERLEADARIKGQASLLDKAQDAIIVRDVENRILFWNKSAERLYGWSQEEAIGKGKLELLFHDPGLFRQATDEVMQHGEWRGEMIQRRKDGTELPVESHWTLVRDDEGKPQAILSINTDITQRKAADIKIQRLAFYDQLTELPNRVALLQRLQHAIATTARNQHHGALMFIDLDNFKALNDTLGHDKGDQLLRLVALRLAGCMRESDTVARIGGDEFVVLLEDLHEKRHEAVIQATYAAEKILHTLNQPYDLDGYEHISTPSIGVALFRGHIDNVDDILKRADLAMYEAKAAGRNAVRFFDPEMQAVVNARVALEADLRHGTRANEFELYYQPQTDALGRLTGVEALVRWNHPSRGFVSPSEFIPLAEETGLIVQLGNWVLESACQQLVSWDGQPETSSLTVAVNVSARQFRHPNFVSQVLEVLDRTGARPENLKLELTESLLLDDLEDTIEKMIMLRKNGVGFSLDDFGTGYSSLSYLKRLPLDQLKIDQSFVRHVLTEASDAAIARTIIALGHSLNLSVIAEGVETEEQRDFLLQQGCHGFQGYLFSRPLQVKQFEQFIRNLSTVSRHAAT